MIADESRESSPSLSGKECNIAQPRTPENKPPDSELRIRAEAVLGRPVEDGEIDFLWQSGWL